VAKGKSKKGKGKKGSSKGKGKSSSSPKSSSKSPAAKEEEPKAAAEEADEPKAAAKDEADTADEPAAAKEEADTADEPKEKRPPDPAAVTMLRKVDDAVGRVEHILLVLFLGTLIGVGTYHSFASQVLNENAAWPFEMIRFSVFFVAMTGAALAAQRQRMISMDIVTRLLGPRRKAIARIFVGLFVVYISYLLVRGGMAVRESVIDETNFEVIRPATGLLALPVGGALIGFHYFVHTLIDILYLANGIEAPEEEALQVH
jgi:TRAP-type C4-dicarboxylate transport system permease small subunit